MANYATLLFCLFSVFSVYSVVSISHHRLIEVEQQVGDQRVRCQLRLAEPRPGWAFADMHHLAGSVAIAGEAVKILLERAPNDVDFRGLRRAGENHAVGEADSLIRSGA